LCTLNIDIQGQPRLPPELRPRAVDSTTVQGPASTGTEWRVHYALDLVNLNCDWAELTDAMCGSTIEQLRPSLMGTAVARSELSNQQAPPTTQNSFAIVY
jgi:hypothetical protein